MYVTTDSAALHLEMIDAFGLPTPASSEIAEVFGWYHVGNGPRYWHFDPHKQLWHVRSERTLHSRVGPCTSWNDQERTEIASALAELNMMEPPRFPDKPDDRMAEPPFLFGSYMFAWLYVPELKRWSLAPLGKFDGKRDLSDASREVQP